MHKKFKKGFTLTELIVVIVIIGVLAAVLIPTISGYVEKAKVSNDTSDVKNMNQILNIDSIFDDVTYYDVDYVEQKLQDNGYDLKTRAKDYTYWYDRLTNSIVLAKTDSVLNLGVSADATGSFTQNTIEALSSKYPSYLYISKNDNVLTKTVEGIRNLVKESTQNGDTKAQILSKMTTNFEALQSELTSTYQELSTYLEKYSPAKALYVTDDGYYSTNSTIVENVVFSKAITTIAPLEDNIKINISSIDLPNSVVYVQSGAFTSKVTPTTVINTTNNVVFEEGSYIEGTVQIQKVQTIEVNDYEISYAKKDVIDNDGIVTRSQGNVSEEVIRCEYAVPTVNIKNTSIPFELLSSCVVRSTMEDGYVRMTLAALTSDNKKYKLENIGYITSLDASTITFAKAKYNIESKQIEPIVTTIVSANITNEILDFYNFKGAEVIINYSPINIDYTIEQNDNSNFVAREAERTVGASMDKTLSLIDFVNNKANLFELLKVEGSESLQLNTIKIIVGDTILFIQNYI